MVTVEKDDNYRKAVPETPDGERSRKEATSEQHTMAEQQAALIVEEAEQVAMTRSKLRDLEEGVKRSEKLAKWLDSRLLDPIMGIAMGAGDVAGGAFGLYIVAEAMMAGMPRTKVFRMVANLAVDTLIGAVPVAGDFLDFFLKPNKKNAAMLRQYFEEQKKAAGIEE